MKRFFLMVTILLFVSGIYSCLDDDNDITPITINATKIDSVDIPTSEVLGTSASIKMYYTRTNSCEAYYGIDFQPSENNRSVTLFTFMPQDISNCNEVSEATSRTLDFRPLEAGLYTFRFWQGVDSEDQNIFLEKQIEITNQ